MSNASRLDKLNNALKNVKNFEEKTVFACNCLGQINEELIEYLKNDTTNHSQYAFDMSLRSSDDLSVFRRDSIMLIYKSGKSRLDAEKFYDEFCVRPYYDTTCLSDFNIKMLNLSEHSEYAKNCLDLYHEFRSENPNIDLMIRVSYNLKRFATGIESIQQILYNIVDGNK